MTALNIDSHCLSAEKYFFYLLLHFLSFVIVAVFTRPILWDGSVAEVHEAQEAGQLPRGHRERKNGQTASGAIKPYLDSAK